MKRLVQDLTLMVIILELPQLTSSAVEEFPRKCCPKDEVMRNKGYCGNSQDIHGPISLICNVGRMLLHEYTLNGNELSTIDSPGFIFSDNPDMYCVGKVYKNISNPSLGILPVAVFCIEKLDSTNDDVETSGVLTIISSIFLALTFAVYGCMPQLRDLQGLCYMCLCISMSLAFLSLGILQLSPNFSQAVCALSGFIVYFWMMATFFWMNVISIHVYRTIVLADAVLHRMMSSQFLWYNKYAWGCSVGLLLVALITNYVEGRHYRPGFGEYSCWFHGRAETWIFFYGPIALLIATNFILFLLSSLRLWRTNINYEVNVLKNLRRKFLLSLKLFLVMGISWIFEIASFAHGQSHIIWKIMDIFNCLQGVVIFVVLVMMRRRVLAAIASKVSVYCPRASLFLRCDTDYSEDAQTVALHHSPDDTPSVHIHPELH